MILSSIPVYFIFVAWKNKPKFFQKGVGKYKLNKFTGEKIPLQIRYRILYFKFGSCEKSEIFLYTHNSFYISTDDRSVLYVVCGSINKKEYPIGHFDKPN